MANADLHAPASARDEAETESEEEILMAEAFAQQEARLRVQAAGLGMSPGDYRAAAKRVGPAPNPAAGPTATRDSAAWLVEEFLHARAGEARWVCEVCCAATTLARRDDGQECWRVPVRFRQTTGPGTGTLGRGHADVCHGAVFAFEEEP